jgi:ribosome-associated toxin RatA of RatAB toxin-antitoxin module
MHTENSIDICGDIEQVFAMAGAVEAWPCLFPHYRRVRVIAGDATERLVEMAAHRDGFPVRWIARQRLDPAKHQIHFTHVQGISRGMEVTWYLEADGPLVHVRIVHDLTLRWPLIGPFVANCIIGKLFVRNIAQKTLCTIKRHVERGRPTGSVEPERE